MADKDEDSEPDDEDEDAEGDEYRITARFASFKLGNLFLFQFIRSVVEEEGKAIIALWGGLGN